MDLLEVVSNVFAHNFFGLHCTYAWKQDLDLDIVLTVIWPTRCWTSRFILIGSNLCQNVNQLRIGSNCSTRSWSSLGQVLFSTSPTTRQTPPKRLDAPSNSPASCSVLRQSSWRWVICQEQWLEHSEYIGCYLWKRICSPALKNCCRGTLNTYVRESEQCQRQPTPKPHHLDDEHF